jgi:hypothetical protein
VSAGGGGVENSIGKIGNAKAYRGFTRIGIHHGDAEARRRTKSLKHRGKEEAEEGKKKPFHRRFTQMSADGKLQKPTTETRETRRRNREIG